MCAFDELQSDVPHNRVIKATLRALGRTENLSKTLKAEMAGLASRMIGIADVPLSHRLFRTVLIGRNNRHYHLLIKICELVFESLIPGEGEAESLFANILQDEDKLSRVFEKFVRNFYIAEQRTFKVRAEHLSWNASFADASQECFLPQLRTDLTMRAPGRTIVLDTKYYRTILTNRMGGKDKLRSGHLYQLLTYLNQVKCDTSVPHLPEGVLLYARAGDVDLSLRFKIDDFEVRAETVNLEFPWQVIHARLLYLLA